ncbi:MAG TPA: transcriptional regulator [Methylophilaceae bacterium]|nr:transcriptional regulator [Methylophilaceae bacterium]
MPDPTMSEAWKEALASAPEGEVCLHTLEFRHPNFKDISNNLMAIRVVLDHQDLSAVLEADAPLNAGQTVVFTKMAFGLELPPLESISAPELKIVMDNVSQDIEYYLALATASPYPVEVTYREYLNTDLSGPQNNPPLNFTLKNPQADDFQITATASTSDVGNRQFPNEDYTSKRFPGLVR